MKINWNEKYNTISMYSFIVVSAIIVFYLSIAEFGSLLGKISGVIVIFQPFIIGFSIAYILNFILKFYEKKLNVYSKLKSKRGLGLVFTYITAMLLIGLFIQFVLPQLIQSIIGLVNDVPKFINESTKFINKLMLDLNISEEYLPLINNNFNEFINYIIKIATNLLPVLGGFVTKIASSIWNIVLGVIISIYLLIDKEKFCAMSKKVTYAIFYKNAAEKIIEITHRSNDTFGKFLMGKILDSFIIGILTFVILTIFRMPYAILISVIIGITNIIPFFGPFIGAIPSFIIILFVAPVKALWFLVIILVIQQIDGNIIGPKILGDSIGISAFWILFSILFAGKFLGLIGMIIGVPLFAVVYSIIKEIVEANLKKKGLKIKTKDYM
ncbi:AI-2E family transporter [Clostridium botulinum]|uniref:AI-2E family transporter n=1 Tax=Clostridium botulinum TaxID=1491 RepID=A0A6B4JML3_CLOBO|nr:AI-2E family transporter [Clostridium botulinum]EES49869.1 putative membrane protein [Clostridium botulinum E1 str. 'BoNT E Beluga']MBY6761529.1 AI-2E family transporter [Clostridium botulinum]MBY6920139.1 AI-2E family transporter [Clostridium botulinum]MCR1131030.1 AI-2E family transporter [Clostridium botulinum]NFH68524.1 AI-2E family transporter [Clostridium botulinum]